MRQKDNFTPDISALSQQHNHGRTILFETVYGSKLYGCDIEGSDHDIRGVYMPGLYDFLTEVKESPETLVPDTDLGESDDIVYFPAGMFIDQVIRMKTNAVEIYFAALNAKDAGATLHPAMEIILSYRDDLISSDYNGFVGHARQRAAKYVEGEDPNDMTLQANKHTLTCLQAAAKVSLEAPAMRIMDIPGIVEAVAEHSSIKRVINKGGDPVLMINSRQLAENTLLAEAIKMTENRLQRFLVKNFDADPEQINKDLCTSLRMMETTADLMETGKIAYPRPRAEHYRDIRRGKIDRKSILADIDAAQERAELAVESGKSPLRPAYMEGQHIPLRDEVVAKVRFFALKALTA